MRRLFPAPYLSLAMFGLWLLLNASLSPGNLLIAAVLGIIGPIWSAPLRPSPVRLNRFPRAVQLTLVVGYDVIKSNFEVAWVGSTFHRTGPRSAFVRIPLDLRDPNGLAALAIIMTVIPGTVWSELAMDRSALLIHVFDVEDTEAWVAHFKSRYEAPLVEIFE
jgi:multicomponent K+:H+ antiporter subunit E